ncbi:hypothetical protein KW782_01670 [Candidatus Parcubacteria bacterium]|nr:hypothetical protein [Candidatus Parcubacteria bacterium]
MRTHQPIRQAQGKKGSAILILIIIVVLAIGVGAYYYSTNHSSVSENTDSDNSPIKILSTEIPANSLAMIKGSIQYDCQPEIFDPKITKYKNVRDEFGNQFQQIDGERDFFSITVDGFNKDGDNKILLNPPYKITNYVFGCASTFSSVAEITKDGVRQGLYTHINNWLAQASVSEDKKYMYIISNVKNANGAWERMRRIVNVETNAKVKLPNMSCALGGGFWSGNKLITITDHSEGINPNDKTQICIWDSQGKLLHRLEAELYWQGANGLGLIDQVGILPSDPNIFYVYSHFSTVPAKEGDICSLYLQDLRDFSKHKEIKIADAVPDSIPPCPRVKFDLSSITYSSKKVDYQIVNEQY